MIVGSDCGLDFCGGVCVFGNSAGDACWAGGESGGDCAGAYFWRVSQRDLYELYTVFAAGLLAAESGAGDYRE